MHKLRIRPLHHLEHLKKLRRLQRSGDAFMARWATILWLSHQGRSVQAIAVSLGLHVQTVRERIRIFNQAERRAAWELLRPVQRSGRPLTYGPLCNKVWSTCPNGRP
jgi:Homeodomain-like domain-containing protein